MKTSLADVLGLVYGDYIAVLYFYDRFRGGSGSDVVYGEGGEEEGEVSKIYYGA